MKGLVSLGRQKIGSLRDIIKESGYSKFWPR